MDRIRRPERIHIVAEMVGTGAERGGFQGQRFCARPTDQVAAVGHEQGQVLSRHQRTVSFR